MKIAIPLAEGRLSAHFGHCAEFVVLEVDKEKNEILSQSTHTPPPHEPGVLPRWLHEQGATVIIAGGMGGRAQDLFAQNGIRVVIGAPSEEPGAIAKAFLENSLQTGENICDH